MSTWMPMRTEAETVPRAAANNKILLITYVNEIKWKYKRHYTNMLCTLKEISTHLNKTNKRSGFMFIFFCCFINHFFFVQFSGLFILFSIYIHILYIIQLGAICRAGLLKFNGIGTVQINPSKWNLLVEKISKLNWIRSSLFNHDSTWIRFLLSALFLNQCQYNLIR